MQLGGDSEMTKEQKIKILILDDDPDREKTRYRPMEDGTLQIKFINLKDNDTIEVIKNLEIEPIDIIFVDHRLDKTASESSRLIPTGKSVTPLLRNKWPKAPVFGVTAAKDDCIKQNGENFYEDVFAISDISQLQDFIPFVVDGYRKVRSAIDTHNKASGFVELLKAPADEVSIILHSIPDELWKLDADNLTHAIYRWFRRTLHEHAGFLYDKKWAAITMGISPDYFEYYSAAFNEARYVGVWSDSNNARWWKKKLYEIAIAERKSPRVSVQAAACTRFIVPEAHRSHCIKCGEVWPEILALTGR